MKNDSTSFFENNHFANSYVYDISISHVPAYFGLHWHHYIEIVLAQRVRKIRKRRSITQEKLASISGVSYGSIKRFETTGQISLLSLTKIAIALDLADELRNIFTQVPYKDIQEVINETR